MALEDSVVDLEVVVPTITKGGDVVEDSKVTSSSIAKKRLQLRRFRRSDCKSLGLSQSSL
jgi:hypothetical protein